MELRSKSRLEDSLHLSPAVSSNATISDADTFRSPSLSQTLSQSQGLLSLPFEMKRSGGLLGSPTGIQKGSIRSSESEEGVEPRESARFVGEPLMQQVQSPTDLLSLPIDLTREAATPHFPKKSPNSSSAKETPDSSALIPSKPALVSDWLSKQPRQLTRPISEGADIKSSGESQSSTKTDGQRLKHHLPFATLDESSIDLQLDSEESVIQEESKESGRPSFLSPSPYDISLSGLSPIPAPPTSLPATRILSDLSDNRPKSVIEEPRHSSLSSSHTPISIISSPSLGQLQHLQIGELIMNSAEPLKFVRSKDSYEEEEEKEDLMEMKRSRNEATFDLFRTLQNAFNADKRKNLKIAVECLLENLREKIENSLVILHKNEEKSEQFYANRLLFRAFSVLISLKTPKNYQLLATEFRLKREFLKLHRYFCGFRKVCRAHKVWIREVQRGFALQRRG